jgi:chromosomal replication initiator protein
MIPENITTPADHTRAMIADVARRHGLTYRDVVGPCRDQRTVRARREAIALVRQAKPHLSYPQLGRLFGRDHTTILHHLSMRK